MKPHKHVALIYAWAYGAEIEYQGVCGEWYAIKLPSWSEHIEFRIKQAKPSKLEVLKKAWDYAREAYWDELHKEKK